MGRVVGDSTLQDVEESELPDTITAGDLTPVEAVTGNLRGLFKGFNKFDDTFIVGEVGNLSTNSDHIYFSINAAYTDSQIKCVVWSSRRDDLDIDVEQDMLVAVKGTFSFFVGGGHPSLEVTEAQLVGESAYWQRIQELRENLEQEGLFDTERKQSLPQFPETVGIVTAVDSDAEQDIIESIHSRYPDVDILVEDSTVQGDKAPAELATAIEAIDDSDADVLVVSRGGGSDVALRSFSEEPVVRAVADAATPAVSAIGHEADDPLVDEVADVRAKTPTAAGEVVVPDKAQLEEGLEELTEDVRRAYLSQVTRWVDTVRTDIADQQQQLAAHWISNRQQAIQSRYTTLVENWLRDAGRDVRQTSQRLQRDWIDTQRATISQETERLSRQHDHKQEMEETERLNKLLVVLVILLLLILLGVGAVVVGLI